MELKWFYRALPRKLARRSNRTFMELKLRYVDEIMGKTMSSNRTFMELKFTSLLL